MIDDGARERNLPGTDLVVPRCPDKAAQHDNQGSIDGEITKYTVGICQLVQHEALDAATQGFIDALNEALPGEVEFQTKNRCV